MTDIVEDQWQKIMARTDEPAWLAGRFTELVRVAYEEPRLRELYPWAGMWELHFSRCTEPRHTWDIPYIAPMKDGAYRIDGPSRSQHVGVVATVGEAVAVVVERLPPGCAPAFVGTAAELDEYERTRTDG
ncbi:DUF6193 family natural product biosynthesis protein [Streptomyces sp. NPDC006984]|uniref:DUF6193 family natural product biosynthesis protein n=1 Tax=Streptomyces sp. NPDC006984 TaxID=3155463 RepID=UPI0033C7EACE